LPLKAPGIATTLSRLSSGTAGTGGGAASRGSRLRRVCASALVVAMSATVSSAAFANVPGMMRL